MEKEKQSLFQKFSSLSTMAKILVVMLVIFVIFFIVAFIMSNTNRKQNIVDPNDYISSSNNNIKSFVVEEADNSRGMRFKVTFDDYINNYNDMQTEAYGELSSLFTIKKSDFKLVSTSDGIQKYSFIRYVGGNLATKNDEERFAILLYVEEISEKIIEVQFMVSNNYLTNSNDTVVSSLLTEDLPRVFIGVDKTLTMDSAYDMFKTAINNNPSVYFSKNTIIGVERNSETSTFCYGAISQKEYNELFD